MISEKDKSYLDIFINLYKPKISQYDKYDIKELLKKFIYNNINNIIDPAELQKRGNEPFLDLRLKKYRVWLKYVYKELGMA